MQRANSKLRQYSWSLLTVLAFHGVGVMSLAQDPLLAQPKEPPLPVLKDPTPLGKAGDAKGTIVLRVNQTRLVGMTPAAGAQADPLIDTAHSDNDKVVKINAIPNDPRRIQITGLATGTSKVTLVGFLDKDMKVRKEETFDVRVLDGVLEEQRIAFLDLVRKTMPASNIDAIAAPNNTVFISGWLADARGIGVVLDAARSIFGQGVNIVNNVNAGGVQQVQIEATVCVVNRSKLRRMTFSWSINRQDYFVSSILGPGSIASAISTGVAGSTASQTATGGNLVFGVLGDRGSFLGFLEALKTENVAKIHSEPRIVTLSGKPAQFISGGETPILTTSGIGSPTVQYRSFGTTITVLPVVLGNGKIHLEVAPVLSSRNDANGIIIPGAVNTIIPGFDTRGAQVTVQMEDGQTVAIGGLIQHSVQGSITKVPILGDIPFLSAAFSSKSYDEREEELLILVTPRLIDPMACNQLPARLPTRLTRTPDDFELFLEGLLELPRGQRQTCGPNGHYLAAHKNGPTAGLYPCGDSGQCGVGMGLGLGHRGAACSPTGCGSVGGCATGTCATGTCPTPAAQGCATGNCAPASYMKSAVKGGTMEPTVVMIPSGPTNGAVVPATMPAAPHQEQGTPAPALRLPNAGPAGDPVPFPLPGN